MPGKGFGFLAMNQNFQLPDLRNVCTQRLRQRVYDPLLAQDSRGVSVESASEKSAMAVPSGRR